MFYHIPCTLDLKIIWSQEGKLYFKMRKRSLHMEFNITVINNFYFFLFLISLGFLCKSYF